MIAKKVEKRERERERRPAKMEQSQGRKEGKLAERGKL